MRIGINLHLSTDYQVGIDTVAQQLADYESAGLNIASLPEGYSFDAVSQLGYLAARTNSMRPASGILQLPAETRSPRR
ncbi:LLM class flavin-dependent oxidoreductase [Nocardia sp. NPDC004278]